jgi:hypothetical protein
MFLPLSNWIVKRDTESDLRSRIARRQALGYATTELEDELARLIEDPEHRRVREERRLLGYEDKSDV